jgi:hypothetical protein
MGNVQLLPNGDVFVGWGEVPYFSEFSKSGKLLFDGVMPAPDMSYRAYVQTWVGQPLTPPSGAARTSGGKTVVYASWNGATNLASWRVLAASGTGSLKTVADARSSGFETAIPVASSETRFEVQALSATGRVLGTSNRFTSNA